MGLVIEMCEMECNNDGYVCVCVCGCIDVCW